MKPDFTDLASLRAALSKSRRVALAKFEKDWGTRNTGTVYAALAAAIPGSASPEAALQSVLETVRGRQS